MYKMMKKAISAVVFFLFCELLGITPVDCGFLELEDWKNQAINTLSR